jgi:hypothetical protein
LTGRHFSSILSIVQLAKKRRRKRAIYDSSVSNESSLLFIRQTPTQRLVGSAFLAPIDFLSASGRFLNEISRNVFGVGVDGFWVEYRFKKSGRFFCSVTPLKAE